ncbi:four helix bundle protein [bacterium]|nr:MAG: four helix bundle protein [bacterium]
MTQTGKTKIYDLEERTFQFAKNTALFCKQLPKTISNREHVSQLIRASGSVGANYIEANESVSKKDFIFRIKICRKESKESAFWIRLIKDLNTADFNETSLVLLNEAIELKKIFSAILEKSK